MAVCCESVLKTLHFWLTCDFFLQGFLFDLHDHSGHSRTLTPLVVTLVFCSMSLYNMCIFAVSAYTFCIFLPGHFLWAQGLNRATVHRAHAQTTNCLEEPVPRELQGSVHFVLSKACTIFRSFFLQLLRQAFEQQMAAMSWRPVRKLLIVSGVLQAAVPQTLQTYRNVQKRVLSTFCQESSRSFE